MNKITVDQATKIMQSGLMFTIQGYKKSDGELINVNGRMGVFKGTKGGTWNGNPQKHILVNKPIRANNKKSEKPYNGFRTLLKDSLIGCTLKANKNTYEIV